MCDQKGQFYGVYKNWRWGQRLLVVEEIRFSFFFILENLYLNIVSGAPLIRSQYDTLLNAVCMFLFYCVFRVSFDSWIA